jgi:hypothetical protein
MKTVKKIFLFLQPLAQQVFPREELPREPAVAGQVQRQRASAQQGAALPHAGLRQSRKDLCPGRIVRGADSLERSLVGKTDCC